MIITVTEPSDERLQPFRWRDRQLASRTDRLETVGAGLFVAEGDLVVERALAAGCTPRALLCDETLSNAFAERLPDIDIYSGPEDLRREVTGLGVPLRAMGLFVRPPLVDAESLLSTTSRVIVAESIDNPTNLGAIIRSAVALGWGGSCCRGAAPTRLPDVHFACRWEPASRCRSHGSTDTIHPSHCCIGTDSAPLH